MDAKSDKPDDLLPNEADEAEGESSERPKITEDQLKEILERHRLYVESGEEKGELANLQGADLHAATLEE